MFTNELDWDPRSLDCHCEDSEEWFDALSHLQDDSCISQYDEFGNYTKRVRISHTEQYHHLEIFIDDAVMYHTFEHDTQHSLTIIPPDDTHGIIDQNDNTIFYDTSPIHLEATTKVLNYDLQRPLFAWIPTGIMKRTHELTT